MRGKHGADAQSVRADGAGRSRARRSLAAAAVGAALITAGCAQSSPNVAAYIGPEEITKAQLTDATAAVNTAIGQQTPVTEQDVVLAMVLGEVSAQIAQSKAITITDPERDAETNPALRNVPGAKQVAYDLADSVIVQKKLGSAEFLTAIKASDVRVNPLYGRWNPESPTGALLDGETGSLSIAPVAQTP